MASKQFVFANVVSEDFQRPGIADARQNTAVNERFPVIRVEKYVSDRALVAIIGVIPVMTVRFARLSVLKRHRFVLRA